jgi:GTP-binding protein HflX
MRPSCGTRFSEMSSLASTLMRETSLSRIDTAGAQIVGRLTQQIASASPATLIGEGKVDELKALIEETGATLVVFDEELTPNQGATLEEEVKRRVMDRAEVILDIFATRARSHEAKLQVELAQNKYLLPRLARMWTHLSRIRGGIGLRGPGETQLETDRRLLRTKIQHLTHKLKDVSRHRAVLRAGRRTMLDAALVGYTNAGKSSLLRSLSGEHDIFVEDRLFATLDTLSREVEIGDGYRARVFDTVGFIRKLPHNLVASFRATLEEIGEADILLHVVDASHEDWEEQWDVVEGVLNEIGIHDLPVVPVFNKMDLVPDPVSFAQRARELHPDAVFSSSMKIDGMEGLKAELRRREQAAHPPVVMRIAMADGKRMAEIYRVGEVLKREEVGEEYELTVRMPAGEAARLGG